MKTREWWQALGEREKRLLSGGGVLALAMLLVLIWRPLVAAQDRLQRQVEQKAALVTWMRRADAEIRQLAPAGADAAAGSAGLRQSLDAAIARQSLDADIREANGELEVAVRKAGFDQVLSLMEIAHDRGATLGAVDIQALKEPGKVAAQLRLQP
ncbi:MAG: type II secretion system protein M [Oceanospirillaceae bacterium]|nr:type II secretion system protein M [Oceanospirillaceae bacterium]